MASETKCPGVLLGLVKFFLALTTIENQRQDLWCSWVNEDWDHYPICGSSSVFFMCDSFKSSFTRFCDVSFKLSFTSFMFYKSEEYSVPGYSRSVNLIQVTLESQEIAVYRCEVRIRKEVIRKI